MYQREPTASPEADKRKFFEVCHDFLGKRYGFDNIVGAYVHGQKQPTCTKITPVIYDEKRKTRHPAKDIIERIWKSLHLQDFIRELNVKFGFDVGVYENKLERLSLAGKSLKVKGWL